MKLIKCVRNGTAAVMTALVLLTLAARLGVADAADVVIELIDYTGDGVSIGYLASPEDADNAPGVILIHEWWGLNDQIRGMADRYAQEGYVALAVDLYSGEATTDADDARALASSVRSNAQRAFTNLSQAFAYLASFADERVDEERIASVGWCFGGGWSYQMASNNLGTAASVIYYGFFNPEDDLTLMRAKILGHFGEEDRAISVDSVEAFQARLRTLSGEHEIYIYPNSGHAFANETGSAYNADAAEEAWQRTLEFLQKHL